MAYSFYTAQAQRRLKEAGYNVGQKGGDGRFGQDTLKAVNAAIADAAFCKESNGAFHGADETYAFEGNLRRGCKGEAVAYLQRMLGKWHMGYYLGTSGADGVFGRGTKAAVTEFQKGMSLKPGGELDEETWSQLKPQPVDISYWITPNTEDEGRLPMECNCRGQYCDSEADAHAGRTSVGLMILIGRIQKELNQRFGRDDIRLRLTDDMDTKRHDDRNGGNRCETWNTMHGGAKNSQHIKRCGADLFCVYPKADGKNKPTIHDLYLAADDLNPYGGVGEYRNNIHVDTRGYRARW